MDIYLDVEIYGHVPQGVEGDGEGGGDLLGVHHVALPLEDPLGEDEDGLDDGVVGGGEGDLHVRLRGIN